MKKLILIIGFALISLFSYSQELITGERQDWSDIREIINGNFIESYLNVDTLKEVKWNKINGGISYDNNVETGNNLIVEDSTVLKGIIYQSDTRNITNNVDSYGFSMKDTIQISEDVTSSTYVGGYDLTSILNDNPSFTSSTGVRYVPFQHWVENYEDINQLSGLGVQVGNYGNINSFQHLYKLVASNNGDGDSIYIANSTGAKITLFTRTLNSGAVYYPKMVVGEFYHIGAGAGRFYADEILGLDVQIRSVNTEKYVDKITGLYLGRNFDATENVGINEEMFGRNYFSSETTIDSNLIVNGNISVADDLQVNGTLIYSSENNDTSFYVNALTGSDETGDGTEANPFQTLEKTLLNIGDVINGVKIIINLQGSNTNYSLNSLSLQKIASFQGSGTLVLQGSPDTLLTNVTTSAIGDDPTLRNVLVGGIAPNWTTNEMEGKFLSLLLPFRGRIMSNDASSLFTSFDFTQESVIIDLAQKVQLDITTLSDLAIKSNLSIEIRDIKIDFSTASLGTYSRVRTFAPNFGFWGCDINLGGYDVEFAPQLEFILSGCYIYNSGTNGIFLYIDNSSWANTIFDGIGKVRPLGSISVGQDGIFIGTEIYFSGANQRVNLYNNRWIKFKDCAQALAISPDGNFSTTSSANKIILDNVTEFIDFYSVATLRHTTVDIHSGVFVGTPTKWLDSSAPKYLTYGNEFRINLEGILYPETQEQRELTLLNNSVIEITIADKTQNRTINVDYVANRNGKIEQGTIQIFHDGTTLYINNTSHDNQSGNGIGLSFDAVFDGTNTDLINLKLTVDDNVDNITFDYSIIRKLI